MACITDRSDTKKETTTSTPKKDIILIFKLFTAEVISVLISVRIYIISPITSIYNQLERFRFYLILGSYINFLKPKLCLQDLKSKLIIQLGNLTPNLF